MFIFMACMLLDSWRDWTFILENKVVRSPPYIAPHIAHNNNIKLVGQYPSFLKNK